MRVPSDPNLPGIRAEVQPGIWLDSRLAVWFSAQRCLAIADLHWGYAASHRARGNLLPAWGDDVIEQRLHSLLDDYAPVEMIWLGDVVHAAEGAARAERFIAASRVPVRLVAGNHDRRWRANLASALARRPFVFHHGDVPHEINAGEVEVIGHHHPAVAWTDGAGGNVKLPALLADPDRLVLPAFSPWAAGGDCRPMLRSTTTVWAVAPRRIFPLPSRQLSEANA